MAGCLPCHQSMAQMIPPMRIKHMQIVCFSFRFSYTRTEGVYFYPPIPGKDSTYDPLIVCSNHPIFFKWPLISGKQCYRIEFLFSLHDFFSNSKVPKMGFFKNLPNICRKIVPKLFKKILDHILCTDNQMVACEKLSIHLLSKDILSLIQEELGQI